MPESVMLSLRGHLHPAWSDSTGHRAPCPGCGGRFPLWSRVLVNDDFVVLTHDGDVICPADPTFGYSVCEDCKGTGTLIDDDGSVSGTVGTEIACSCSAPGSIPAPSLRAVAA